MTPPLVRATVGVGKGERVQVIGELLGRMQRVGGKPTAGEVEYFDPALGRRVTLVPIADLVLLNDAARAVFADAGPTPRSQMLGPA